MELSKTVLAAPPRLFDKYKQKIVYPNRFSWKWERAMIRTDGRTCRRLSINPPPFGKQTEIIKPHPLSYTALSRLYNNNNRRVKNQSKEREKSNDPARFGCWPFRITRDRPTLLQFHLKEKVIDVGNAAAADDMVSIINLAIAAYIMKTNIQG